MSIPAMANANQQWQTAADLLPQLICLTTDEGRLLRVNRTLEGWGLGTVAGALGRELHDILHPGCTDKNCYFKRFWDRTAPARLEHLRTEHEAFDKVLNRHFAIRVQPLMWHRRGPARANEDPHSVVIVDDISNIRQAEAGTRLRTKQLTQQVAQEVKRRSLSEEVQERLLTIIEQTTDYVAMSDAGESMLYINPAGRAMLGLGPDDDISEEWLCQHADREVQEAIREVAIPSAIANGLWSGESRIRDSKGKQIHASQIIIAHRASDGQVDCVSTILRDISGRVSAEQELRKSREDLRQLSELLVTIQENERRRIALDLHDGLGQSLTLIKLSLETMAGLLDKGATDAARGILDKVVPSLKEALRDVRRVSTDLRPSMLDDLGILPTLSWYFREFESVCGGIEIEKIFTVSEPDIPEALKITLFRVIQEATTNVVKHAAANRITVSLGIDDRSLRLVIEDNGKGFDPDHLCVGCQTCSADNCHGLGLVGMKERVSLSGGVYQLTSKIGSGTQIEATWKLEKRRRKPGAGGPLN